MQQHGSKYFACSPPPPPPKRPNNPHTHKLKGITHTPTPEHGHVAYQIKGNRECSKMLANVFAGKHLP